MIGRRSREQSVFPQRFIINERFVVTGGNQLPSLRIKAHRPIERLNIVPAPGIGVKIMYEVSASHYQDAFVAKRGKLLSEFVMKRRRLSLVDRELNDRNISIRKDMYEHRPRSMVEAPTTRLLKRINGQ